MTRIAFLPEGDERVSASRIRAIHLAKHVAALEAGVSVDVYAGLYGPNATRREPTRFLRRLRRRGGDLRQAKDADWWFVHRGTQQWGHAGLIARAAKRYGVPVAFDLDDAVHLKAPHATRQIAQASRTVLAGNAWLRDEMHQWNANSIWFPTGLDACAYHHPDAKDDDRHRPVIGWIGGVSNLHYLEVCADALRQVNAETPFDLHLVTDHRRPLALPFLHGLNRIDIQWHEETAPRHVAAFDVGIMPLKASPWEKGKCAYKTLEYMAASATAVATLQGDAPRLLSEDRGFGVEVNGGTEAWTQALHAALADKGRRAQRARAYIEEVHDYPVVAKRLVDILDENA